MKITDDIFYIGVDDLDIDLFEGQFKVPQGMAYNSYLIKGDKIAVMDTVDARKADEWLEKISANTDRVDYLVVQHMESDHSACIDLFARAYPDAKIVSSAPSFAMMKNFFDNDYASRRVVVKEGDALDLGGHVLNFVAAPMVHWPEVIVTYDSSTKTLFSADGFGRFGPFKPDDEWDCEARRYYFGIVGKFGDHVQALLKKASSLEIARILPLHGPVHDTLEMVNHVISKYSIWSSYAVESPGVMIAYTSVYGHTAKAVEKLANILKEKGCPKVVVNDLARVDMHEAIEDAFRYGKLILATTTYNMGVFPFMREFINHLTSRAYKRRKIALIENGSWAPFAAKCMRAMFEGAQELEFVPEVVTIKGEAKETEFQALERLANEILK